MNINDKMFFFLVLCYYSLYKNVDILYMERGSTASNRQNFFKKIKLTVKISAATIFKCKKEFLLARFNTQNVRF